MPKIVSFLPACNALFRALPDAAPFIAIGMDRAVLFFETKRGFAIPGRPRRTIAPRGVV
jgi:hypothetical protein